MKGKKLYILIAAVAILAVAGYIISRGGQVVTTVKVEPGTISSQVDDTAIVQAVKDEKIYASQNARVVEVYAEIGQNVTQGQVLLKLENVDLGLQMAETRSRLAQADASITTAQARAKQSEKELSAADSEFKRTEGLFRAGAVSRQQYEQAELKLEAARSDWQQQQSLLLSYQQQAKELASQLQQLQGRSTELEVVSPITGTLLELPVKLRQPVMSGSLLAAVGSSEQLELKADILSDDLAEIKIGQSVIISAPVLGDRQITGQVAKIYPRAEEKVSALGVIQRRVPVIIALNEKAYLQPGYEVRVAIETKRLEKVLVLPLESVGSRGNQGKQVLLVKDNRVSIHPVQTGLSDDNFVEITGGLKEGDLVIRNANLEIKDKTRVKLQKE